MDVGGVLTYEGSNYFRQRLVLSTLSGKPVRIRNIRANAEEPGLQEHEASFIRLLDRISNGTHIEVNRTGTALLYRPGVLAGGTFTHQCPNSRAIGYFLEPLMMMAPFCKTQLRATLTGVTNNKIDPTVDMIRLSLVKVLEKFMVVDEGLALKMNKRGLPPGGGGEVYFSCPVVRTLKPFQWEEAGKVQRIRGVAYAARVAPTVANRALTAAKQELTKYLTDVYLTVDNAKGNSPGYGVCLTARTTKGTVYSAESMSNHRGEADVTARLPEDVGKEAAWRLLEEVWRGGCTDTQGQMLVLLFMVLGPKDVSKFVAGPLTPHTMHFMRHLKDFFGTTFKIEEYRPQSVLEEEVEERTGSTKILLTCVGVGYSNISKGQV